MEDGLYLFGQWVAEVEVNVTQQCNDLTNPQQLQTTTANLFTLPDTTAIRKLLQNAEQVDAGGRDPYRKVPAQLIDEGEVIFSGDAILLSFQGGWKVSLSSDLKTLFVQLGDTKLSDLDLSRYDHPWTIETIANYAENTDGIVYPAIDYGGLSKGSFAQDTLTPGIYLKTLIGAMLGRYNYRPVGAWIADPLYNRLVLPFVGEDPKSHDEEWQQARYARVTVTGRKFLPPLGGTEFIFEYNRDNELLNNWVDGKQNNFKAESFRYVCDVAMRLRVQAFFKFAYKVSFGSAETALVVVKNGQDIVQEYDSQGGPYNLSLNKPTQLQLNELVECRAGDQIQIRFYIRRRSFTANWEALGIISDDTAWASFEPDTTIYSGDVWPVAPNLPDLACAEVLKGVALMQSATFDIEDVTRQLELKLLDKVLEREVYAKDLSHAVCDEEPENKVTIEPYGQKNYLKWKEQENKDLKGYGDGVISCNAQNIPAEAPLFELPFSAVINSDISLGSYGKPPLIKTRVVSGKDESIKINKQSAPACLLLVEPTKPFLATVDVVTPELTIRPTEVPLTPCWWSERPLGAMTDTNAFSLAFDRPSGVTGGEQTLSQRYFNALRRILRRPRIVTLTVYLTPSQFIDIDLYSPVRIRQVRAGSLDFSDSFFYLNKISNYRAGTTCSVTLIAY